jgi:hypothetical protein
MAKKKAGKKNEKPKVNEELEGFNLKVDSFGEIQNSLSIDKINEFLNKNVEDKKLKDRDDIKVWKEGQSDAESEGS